MRIKELIIKVLQSLYCILFYLFAYFGVWVVFGVVFGSFISGWLAVWAMMIMKVLYSNSLKQ